MNAFAPNAFSGAMDDLFADPNIAVSVTYQGRPVRALVRRPDRDVQFGGVSIHAATLVLEVRVAEIAAPQAGDRVEVDGENFVVQGNPSRDAERLVWTLDMRPES